MPFTSRWRATPGLLAATLLLTAVTGLLSTTTQAQPTEASAQGETLSPEAIPSKKGAYLSDWYNQDLTFIGSKDISFGPQPVDDIYLDFGDGNFRARSEGYYAGVGYQF